MIRGEIIMICYSFWKDIIADIKRDYETDFCCAWVLLILIILTPLLAIVDILIFPYSICYLIVHIIRKKK